jgi:hypothetical protein
MSGVFQNIDPPPPHMTGECVLGTPPPPPLVREGGHTRLVERGWGVNILEDGRQTQLWTLHM